jgi:phenylpropionate dioxygenase-like ring-hydroxylating dioxygenase large terminal subunit
MTSQANRHAPPPIPNGWFAVSWSKDLAQGEVKRIRYFDEDLVLFRTRSGRPVVLDAYCAHLGAHLGEGGRVMGETLRCPFHGWQYDTDGACTHIPYCKRVPQNARIRSWSVVERNHMVMVWHHAEGKPPSWDVPTIVEFDDPAWTEPRTFDFEVAVHMQDMAENNCDPVHFQYVHKMVDVPPTEISYAEGGRFMLMVNRSEQETPMGSFMMQLDRETYGLGLVTVRSKGIPGAGLLMFSSTSPIDADHTHSRWLFTVTRNLADVAGEEFIDAMSSGVMQDMRVWENKIHRRDPVLCEADEYLVHFRRWARQFYSDSAPQSANREE